MLAFEVRDMTCGHCVSAITKAVELADPGARVQIDLAAHSVQIHPVSSNRELLAAAISAAGYTPTDSEALASSMVVDRKGGCCCG